MRLIRAVALVVLGMAWLGASRAQVPQLQGKWAQPVADLTAQIADILGPGQAQLTLRNLSTIQAGELPAIRKLLEQNLKARGVLASGSESANAIRVTLSENLHERLWVAEVVEGNETHVVLVHVDGASAVATAVAAQRVMLRKDSVMDLFDRGGQALKNNSILAAAEINGHFVALYADRISIFNLNDGRWIESNTFAIQSRLTHDPRGMLLANVEGSSFTAYAPGEECTGSYSLPLSGVSQDSGWVVRCRASDEPWPVYQSGDASSAPALKAFYNSARDYFTGVVAPNLGIDLPAFYAAGMIPRPAGGAALLVTGVDGKVQMVENGAMRPVAGTRDWGSDFAIVRSGCGAGTQLIASSSGEAANDSLRAFEIPALDALPVSSPLSMEGTVTAIWTAQDGKSAMAVVRNAANEYEVARVTALCN